MTSETKTIVDFPEAFDAKDSCSENTDCEKRKSRKKRLFIVVIALLATLICIAVIAIALVSFWTTKVKLQQKEHKTIGDKEVDQELYQDAFDSLTIYHIVDGTTKTCFILDYNREIVVMRLNVDDLTSICYVQPFDSSTVSERNLTSTSTTTPSSQVNDAPRNQSLPALTLRTSSRPIKEKSMLGRRGQELCKEVDTFWILSSSGTLGSSSGNDVGASRVRRAQMYTYYGCWFNWGNCYYITFSDTPLIRYYTCAWTCGIQTYYY